MKLNPDNPVALITKAESLTKETCRARDHRESRRARPAMKRSRRASEHELIAAREALRDEIRELALRAIATDPLNARAFRLLAEISDDADQVRMLMQEAFHRSRRESVAAFWLLNDSFYKRDYRSALYYADILLRTRSRLGCAVFDYSPSLLKMTSGRELLTAKLANESELGALDFFQVLPSKAKSPETPLALMTALQELGKSANSKRN